MSNNKSSSLRPDMPIDIRHIKQSLLYLLCRSWKFLRCYDKKPASWRLSAPIVRECLHTRGKCGICHGGGNAVLPSISAISLPPDFAPLLHGKKFLIREEEPERRKRRRSSSFFSFPAGSAAVMRQACLE